MAIRPTESVDWAIGASALKLQPTAQQRTWGWTTHNNLITGVPEKPTLQHQNGWQYNIQLWVKYLEDFTDELQASDSGKAPIDSPSFTTKVLLPNGTVGIPSIGFASDDDGSGNGFYRVGANSIGLASNGVNTWTVSSIGRHIIGPTAGLGTGATAYHSMIGSLRNLSVSGQGGMYFSSNTLSLGVRHYLDGAGAYKADSAGTGYSRIEIVPNQISFIINTAVQTGADNPLVTTGQKTAAFMDTASRWSLGDSGGLGEVLGFHTSNGAINVRTGAGNAGSVGSVSGLFLGSNMYRSGAGTNRAMSSANGASYILIQNSTSSGFAAFDFQTAQDSFAANDAIVTNSSKGSITVGGTWTIGPSAGGVTHLLNGRLKTGPKAWPTTSIGESGARVVFTEDGNGDAIFYNGSDTIAAGNSYSITLGARTVSGGNGIGGARLTGFKENATSNNYQGGLTFATSQAGGSYSDAGSISSSGGWVFGPVAGGVSHTMYGKLGFTRTVLPATAIVIDLQASEYTINLSDLGAATTSSSLRIGNDGSQSGEIVGRTGTSATTSRGLSFYAMTHDSNTNGDMLFDVREQDNTAHGTLTSNAYVFRTDGGVNMLTATRQGSWSLGPITGGPPVTHVLYGRGDIFGGSPQNVITTFSTNQAYSLTDVTTYAAVSITKPRSGGDSAVSEIAVTNTQTSASSNCVAEWRVRAAGGGMQRCITIGGTGSVAFNNIPSSASAGNCFIDGSNNVFKGTASSIRYKKDVRDLEGINPVWNMRPITFRSILEADDPDQIHYGFIAEEMAEVSKLLTVYAEIDGKLVPDSVAYMVVVVPLVAAVQELKSRIEALEARL